MLNIFLMQERFNSSFSILYNFVAGFVWAFIYRMRWFLSQSKKFQKKLLRKII